MKKICIILFLILGIVTARAYDFEAGGIFYNIVSVPNRTVVVTHSCGEEGPSKDMFFAYNGDVVIPGTVEFQGRTFNVVGIGVDAFAYCYINSIKFAPSIKFIDENAFREAELKSLVIPASMEIVLSLPQRISGDLIIEESNEPLFFYAKKDGHNTYSDYGLKGKNVYVRRTIIGGPYKNNCCVSIDRKTSTVVFGKKVSAQCIYDHIERSLEDREFFFYPLGENKDLYKPVPITIVLERNVPPVMPNEFSKDRYLKTKIVVPQAALSQYQAAPIWCNFFNLEGY